MERRTGRTLRGFARPRCPFPLAAAPRPRTRTNLMSTVIETLERAQLQRVPEFDAGDRLRVHFQVIEGTRRRTQVFEGVVIKRQGHGVRETFTVRKQSFGVGVERMFPLHSPKIERIEVAARGDVRRAKLYYLRDRVGKRARVRERRSAGPEVAVERGLLYTGDPFETTDGLATVDPTATTADESIDQEGAVEPLTTEELAESADAPVQEPAPPTDDEPADPAADEPPASGDE
jgi:large subunit ribosomal protein L19